MTKRPLKNVAASVRERLLNEAKRRGRTFNEVLQYFAIERFLFRLAQSPHATKFVLKGAIMLSAWRGPFTRPTMDVDLLGRTANDVEAVAAIFREVSVVPSFDDGLTFDPTTLEAERIAADAMYGGVRVRVRGLLGTARVVVQADIGFGDRVVPRPVTTEVPSIIAMPPTRLDGYTRESAIAEKLEAMVKLGTLNSRMKDFFDIWFLSQHFEFDGATLSRAIAATFAAREQVIPSTPIALTHAFSGAPGKEQQWRAFLKRGRLDPVGAGLASVVDALARFLGPVVTTLAEDRSFTGTWNNSGSWS
jgi:hypothetical protein